MDNQKKKINIKDLIITYKKSYWEKKKKKKKKQQMREKKIKRHIIPTKCIDKINAHIHKGTAKIIYNK